MDVRDVNTWPIKKIAFGVVGAILALVLFGNLVQDLDAGRIMVIQAPASGKLTWSQTPGLKKQMFGTPTVYRKRHQFYFKAPKRDTKDPDLSLPTRFNDNARAFISGEIAWEMPTDTANLNALHAKYGSDEAIEQQIVRATVEKVITMTGPLMSTTESFASRKNDLLFLVLDQVQHGVYRTIAREEKIKDEMTGQEKTIKVVNPIASNDPADHGWARQEPSPLDEFKIHAFNLTIDDIIYEESVTKQITAQQDAIIQVQTAIAQSKTAEQAAITAQKNGEAEAAKAKWAQEVIKATAVTQAEQEREVARLAKETAEFTKQKLILEGEGEATKRRLVMAADGALDKKLAAWQAVQGYYAEAIKGYTGAWVPSIVMGNAGNTAAGSGASSLIDMLMAKTAKDLALDFRATLSGGGGVVAGTTGGGAGRGN